jgi:aromatic ring-opening dioxygenase LigB subunit
MEELGRRFAASKPDVVVVATPHNVHIAGALAVVVAGRTAGELAGAPPSICLDLAIDHQFAMQLLHGWANGGVPSVGVSFGANDPLAAVAPMDWGTLIPLWFMGGRAEPPVHVVVIAPSRDLPASEHVKAGAVLADVARRSKKRVALIASADHGHAHLKEGPYGYDPKSAEYDKRICSLVRRHRLDELAAIPVEFVEEAKADSWWQMLILHGAIAEGWTGELISYEAPTYFGMLTAAYAPIRGTSSRPRTRIPRRTGAKQPAPARRPRGLSSTR